MDSIDKWIGFIGVFVGGMGIGFAIGIILGGKRRNKIIEDAFNIIFHYKEQSPKQNDAAEKR